MTLKTNSGDVIEIKTVLSNSSTERFYWHYVILNDVRISQHRKFEYAEKRMKRLKRAIDNKKQES